LYYDSNTNTVIIRDIPSTLELFDKMIADLETIGDKEGGIATSVRSVKNAYTGYVYTGITNFLSVRSSATGQPLRAGVYPEYNTNSSLIFGPTEEIKVINELIDKLDSPELTAQELHVIPLKHQPASTLVSIVSNYLYSGKTGVKAPFVSYQESTNSLLVQAANESRKSRN
jgi:type II secretory pathway component GspD/PulD (secretin)